MIKYIMLLIATGMLLMGCKKAFNGTIPGEGYLNEQNNADPYFFEGVLKFAGDQEPILIDYGDNSDTIYDGDNNSFLIYNDSVYSELYSAWAYNFFSVVPYADNGYYYDDYMDHYMMKYGYHYSHVMSKGITFCFFHPQGNAKWDEATVNDFFQEGKEFEFGFEPGNVEVAYYKNNDILNENKNHGILTTPASNADGYLRIEKTVNTVGYYATRVGTTSETVNGKQITISFKCKLYKQYTEDYSGEIEGETSLFIPIEE